MRQPRAELYYQLAYAYFYPCVFWANPENGGMPLTFGSNSSLVGAAFTPKAVSTSLFMVRAGLTPHCWADFQFGFVRPTFWKVVLAKTTLLECRGFCACVIALSRHLVRMAEFCAARIFTESQTARSTLVALMRAINMRRTTRSNQPTSNDGSTNRNSKIAIHK
jgi:hypothetical protein